MSTDGAPLPPARPRPWRRILRAVVAVVAVGFIVLALRSQWGEIGSRLRDLSVGAVAAGMAGILAAVFATMMAWRTLLADLGSPLGLVVAMRIFSLGQIGKYLPGWVWSMVGQMELARDHHVPRSRTALAGLLILALSVVTALVVAAATLPFVLRGSARQYLWMLWALPVGLVALHPRVLRWVLGLALRILRRGPLTQSPSTRGLLVAAVWSLLSWLGYGLHVWLLAGDLGGSGAALMPLTVGAFAGAWVAGFLFVVAPAGAGVREGVLVLALSTVVSVASATLIALVSRLLVTIGDLLWAGAGVLLTGSPAGRPVASEEDAPG